MRCDATIQAWALIVLTASVALLAAACTVSEADLDRALTGRGPSVAADASPMLDAMVDVGLDADAADATETGPSGDATPDEAGPDQSPEVDAGPPWEEWPIHAFDGGLELAILPTEVTGDIWRSYLPDVDPPGSTGAAPELPLGEVTEAHAAALANAMAAKFDDAPCYLAPSGEPYGPSDIPRRPRSVPACGGVRLPSEAEYARLRARVPLLIEESRLGSVAWMRAHAHYDQSDDPISRPPGEKAAIDGLYDILGNQNELIDDGRRCGCDSRMNLLACQVVLCCPTPRGDDLGQCPEVLDAFAGFRLVRTVGERGQR